MIGPSRLGARLAAAILAGGMILALGACGDDRPEVTIYCSVDDHVARPILAEFERTQGIRVNARFDAEATKTTGLVNRIRAERDRPQADLLWSSEPFMTVQLAEEGLLDAPPEDVAASHPEAWRDESRRWHAFAGRARVIVYAPDRVPQERLPRTWMDLVRPWWKDRVVMADPRFGTTRGHVGAMEAYWSREVMPGYFEAFLEGLAENGVRMLPGGNAAVVEAVAAGEADVGLTDTDDVWIARDRGLAVAFVLPRHAPDEREGGGTLVVPNTAALVRGGPSRAAAIALLEHLLSAEVEAALLASPSRNIPLVHAGEITSDRLEAVAVADPLRIDLARAARAMDRAVAETVRRLSEVRLAPATREVEEDLDPELGESLNENLNENLNERSRHESALATEHPGVDPARDESSEGSAG